MLRKGGNELDKFKWIFCPVYVRGDAEIKREILVKVSINPTSELSKWKDDPQLMIWLKNLGK